MKGTPKHTPNNIIVAPLTYMQNMGLVDSVDTRLAPSAKHKKRLSQEEKEYE